MVPYVSEYNSWYQTVHHEDTQHTQLIWTFAEVTAHLPGQYEILGLELSRKGVDCDTGHLKLPCSPAVLCSRVRTNYSVGHHCLAKLLFLFLYRMHSLQGNVFQGEKSLISYKVSKYKEAQTFGNILCNLSRKGLSVLTKPDCAIFWRRRPTSVNAYAVMTKADLAWILFPHYFFYLVT